jgi:Replication factor A protein 3
MTDQEDGAYPRINGAMLQSQQYTGMLVSAVGKVTGHNTLLAADGVSISLDTDSIAEALMVNPGVAVEIIGIAHDATTIQVRDSSSLL